MSAPAVVVPRYFGDWSSHADVVRDLSESGPSMAADAEILVADYTYEDYSGSAFGAVRARRAGVRGERRTLARATASKASGRRKQLRWEALAMRRWSTPTPAAATRILELIAEHVPGAGGAA